MVTFQCDYCANTLKKKQVERHFSFECRNAHSFSCLDCCVRFDRDSVKGHTSCITEVQKYHGQDAKAKNVLVKKVHAKEDFENVKWGTIRKVSKDVLNTCNDAKSNIDEFIKKLAEVYIKEKKITIEEIDLLQLRKKVLDKLEENEKFVLDLSRNIIRYKF